VVTKIAELERWRAKIIKIKMVKANLRKPATADDDAREMCDVEISAI
jgi:hypothetical protein